MKKLLSLIGLLVVQKMLLACDFASYNSFKVEYEKANIVFVGEVISIEDDTSSCFQGDCIAIHVRIKVLNNYKGIRNEYVINTMKNTASCGYPFKIGHTYLIYAEKREDSYYTSLSSRTSEENTEFFIADIQAINKK